jgi:hypothetical protein
MSSESPSLMSSLETIRDQYRRQSLEDRLEAVAEDLRDIKLQLAIMDELFGTDISVDRGLTTEVKQAREAVAANDYDTLSELITELEESASENKSLIETSLNQQLATYQQEVNAMVRLNERLEAFPSGRLDGLQSLLDTWNWKEAAVIENKSDFKSQYMACRDLGQNMATIREKSQEAIVEPLTDGGIEDIVHDILSTESVYLSDLTPEERKNLAKSDLGDAVVLSLG